MNRIASRITLGVAFGLLSLVPSTASAQTTFTACRVPDVGAIYMIGVTGAPSACLDASHVEFSWTEGSASGNVAGSQVTGFSSSVAIATTSNVQLHSVSVPGSTAGIVNVTAHVYVEKDATTTGRYRFELRTGDCSGTLIGSGFWRPLAGAGFDATTITVTGTASGVSSTTSIVFCGAKFDGGAPTATAYLRGVVANW